MSVFAIGDVQGCFAPLCRLLEDIDFQTPRDELWLVGDLVNRGPDSLDVLRFVKSLNCHARVVLGNHDLHCIAMAYGVRKPGSGDTLQQVMDAPDRQELIEWLCHCPLLYEQEGYRHVMVHAGIPPAWDLETARSCARELETVLAGPQRMSFLQHMYGDAPHTWDHALNGISRLRYITNAFTRLRYCHADGRMDFAEKRPPGEQAPGLLPWFQIEGRLSQNIPIIFGHWASLQANRPLTPNQNVLHIDTGCVWGGPLTAVRLEDQRRFSVPGLTA